MKNLAFLLPILFLLPTLAHASCGHVSRETISTSTVLYSTNVDRCKDGVDPVSYNVLLEKAAQQKANDMAKQDYFAHLSPQGHMVWDTILKDGYDYRYAGENLAKDFSDIKSVNTAWLNSPTHKANIVNIHYTEMGVGVSGDYIVVIFGDR